MALYDAIEYNRRILMKKVFAVLILATLIAGGVFAQSGGANIWVSGQISLLGGGARYERYLTPNWSVGGAAYFSNLFFFWSNAGVKAFGRYYPWAGNFFAELGLGYGYKSGWDDFEVDEITYGSEPYSMNGFLIEPGAGWKIDVGAPAGFYIEPVITIPLVLGKKKPSGWWDSYYDSKFGVGWGVVAAFGMGYAF
jgi:hypothetical protein